MAANFITGLISMFLGIFGRLILKVVPPAALLVPIAGIGIAFLGLEQLTYSIAAPIVGFNAILWYVWNSSSRPARKLTKSLCLGCTWAGMQE